MKSSEKVWLICNSSAMAKDIIMSLKVTFMSEMQYGLGVLTWMNVEREKVSTKQNN